MCEIATLLSCGSDNAQMAPTLCMQGRPVCPHAAEPPPSSPACQHAPAPLLMASCAACSDVCQNCIHDRCLSLTAKVETTADYTCVHELCCSCAKLWCFTGIAQESRSSAVYASEPSTADTGIAMAMSAPGPHLRIAALRPYLVLAAHITGSCAWPAARLGCNL